MAVSSTTYKPQVAVGAKNVKITNLSLGTPSTEESHSLQDSLKSIIIRSRDTAKLQVAFTATESGTKYLTIPGNATLALDALEFSGKILYVQSNQVTTVEIVELYS